MNSLDDHAAASLAEKALTSPMLHIVLLHPRKGGLGLLVLSCLQYMEGKSSSSSREP